jgi:hypothetical protein
MRALLVLKQRVTLGSQRVDEHAGPAIVIVIGEIDAHSGESLSIFIEGHRPVWRDVFSGFVRSQTIYAEEDKSGRCSR